MASRLRKLLHAGAFALVPAIAVAVSGIPTPAQGPGGQPIVSQYVVSCSGYITPTPPSNELIIAGADREAVHDQLAQGDIIYLNQGRGANLQVGAEYQVVRNIGPIRDLKDKKRTLGSLIAELGVVRIVALQDNSATAEITSTCDVIFLGDILVPYEKKPIPTVRPYQPLNVAGAPTGRTSGAIIAANYSKAQLAANDIVYLNVGADSGVKVGDYLTIHRPLGSDPINKVRDDRIGPYRNDGFQNPRYNNRNNQSLTSARQAKPKVLEQVPRNTLPRALIGEVVILRVEAGTATAIITRTTREAFIGDSVELQ